MNKKSSSNLIPQFLAFTALAILSLVFTLSCGLTEKDMSEADKAVSIVPYPKSVSFGKGYMSLKEELVVIVSDEALLPYAEVFSENVKTLIGKSPLLKSAVGLGRRSNWKSIQSFQNPNIE